MTNFSFLVATNDISGWRVKIHELVTATYRPFNTFLFDILSIFKVSFEMISHETEESLANQVFS